MSGACGFTADPVAKSVVTLRVIYKDYKEGSGEMPVQGQVGLRLGQVGLRLGQVGPLRYCMPSIRTKGQLLAGINLQSTLVFVQEVTFQYTGYNESGTVIDSSYRHDRPAQTQLGVGGLIPGGCGGSHTKWVWGSSYIYRVCWPERPPPAALDPQGPTSGFLPVTQSVLLLPFTGFDLALRTMRVGTQRRFIVPPALGPPVGPSTFFSAKQCEVRASSLEEQRSLYIGRVCRPPILRTGNKCGMAR